MEAVDTVTDLVSQPLLYDFGPGLLGVCHAGIIQAARATIDSAIDTLVAAVTAHPELDVLITGALCVAPCMGRLPVAFHHLPSLLITVGQAMRFVIDIQ
jgi:hypothetical protein